MRPFTAQQFWHSFGLSGAVPAPSVIMGLPFSNGFEDRRPGGAARVPDMSKKYGEIRSTRARTREPAADDAQRCRRRRRLARTANPAQYRISQPSKHQLVELYAARLETHPRRFSKYADLEVAKAAEDGLRILAAQPQTKA